jgi:adenylate cyclase
LRMTGLLSEMSYGRAVRDEVLRQGGGATPAPEIPLPGLADAQAQLALPLHVDERLLGVLAFEDRDPLAFDEWDEAYLQIVADQVARAIDRVQRASDDDDEPPPKSGTPQALAAAAAPSARPLRKFLYYRKDDCVFVDGDYLVRNVPGKLLWKMLTLRDSEGRVEFCNREFRLDASLGLPTLKDNLESRLILLRKRLLEKCPDIRIVPVRRGRFALEVDCEIELREADGA